MHKSAATTADVVIFDTAIIAADLDVYTHSATTLSLSLLYIYKDVSWLLRDLPSLLLVL